MREAGREMRLFDSGYVVFDSALERIARTIGARPAESGGALLGAYGDSVVTDFVFDEGGANTAASYVPSAELTTIVRREEDARNLQFKGVVHSHPGTFDQPSGPDEHSFESGLIANPELARYLAPIITLEPGRTAANKLNFRDEMWVSFHVATRHRSGKTRVAPCMPKIVWFARDVRRISTALGLAEPVITVTDANELYCVSAELQLPDSGSLVLAASRSYPEYAPLVLWLNQQSNETEQLHVRWQVMDEPEHRLAASLSDMRFFGSKLPRQVVRGRAGRAITTQSHADRRLTMEPVLVDESFGTHVERVDEGLFARSRGVLTDRMKQCSVLVAGCGSVGSYVAEHFVRCGVGEITLLDPDTVDFANLSRANFLASDVGRLKIDALADRLLSISPNLKVNFLPNTLQDLSREQLTHAIEGSSLVMSALDDRRAQLQLNQWAYWYKKPIVFIGAFAKAVAGEVAVVDAPSPCFACATVFRDYIPVVEQGEHDYGVGRLVSEVALAADIQSIAAVGVRLGLSCLMKGTGTSLESFAAKALTDHQYAIFAVSRDFTLVEEILRDAKAQHGHRSVWLTVNKSESCNVCGPNPGPPMIDKAPSITDIKAALRVIETQTGATQSSHDAE